MGKHALTSVRHYVNWDDPIMTEDGEGLSRYIADTGTFYRVQLTAGDMNRVEGAEIVVTGASANVDWYVADLDAPTTRKVFLSRTGTSTYTPKH